VLAVSDKAKREGFERLLKAGGAKVHLFDEKKAPSGITFALVDTHYKNNSPLLQPLLQANIRCLSQDFLAEFLCSHTSPSPSKFRVTINM